MISRIRMLAAASAVAVLAVTSGATTATAQTVNAEWAFAPRGIFADDRVVQSMRLQMDTDAAATACGVSLDYLEGADLFAPPGDELVLLMAAGILGYEETQVVGVTATRACRVWSGGTEGPEAEALAATSTVLSEEWARVWGDLGVSFAPCEVTDDPAQADLLVFPAGSTPGAVDLMAYQWDGSFLASVPLPGAIPGGTGGGEGPGPASTGSLGASEAGATAAEVAWATLLTVITVALARALTRRRTGIA